MATTSLSSGLRETLAVFEEASPGTPLTTNEVTDYLAVGRRSTYTRLERLADRDLIETKKVGARGRVWWRPPVDAAAYAGADEGGRARMERGHFGALVDAVEEYAIFTLDADGRVRTWNDGAAQILGYDREAVLGEHVSTFSTAADRAAGVPEGNLATAEAEGSVEYEGWRVRADGSHVWARVAIAAIRDDEGELVGFTTVTRDLTDRSAGERALRRERDRLERIVEASHVGIGAFDAGGEPVRVNGRFAALLGVEGDGSDGDGPGDGGGAGDGGGGHGDWHALDDVTAHDEHGEVLPAEERPHRVAAETGEPVTDERMRVVGVDGEERWLSVDAVPLPGKAGGVVVTVADETASERRARRLARERDEVETELQHVFDRVDEAFWALDEEFRFTYVNRRATELLDRPAAELVGARVWDALPLLEETRAREELEAAMATQSARQYEDFVEATGRWYDIRLYPSESGVSVYFEDVTSRKAREEALAASERHNRALVDNFPNGVVALFDRKLRHTLVGGSLFEVIDRSVDEVEGKTVREIFPDRIADRLEPNFEAVFDGESNVVEVEAGGKVRQFRTLPIRDDEGEIVAGLGMSQDVTERRRRQRELERYETIVETVADGIYALDPDANFVLANDAFCEMVGYDREELLGSPATVVHNDSIDRRAAELASEVDAGERSRATLEFRLRSKDGEVIPVESRFGPYAVGDGFGRCGVVRDVSERLERERELERYVGIVDAVGEPVYELDERGRFTFVNDAMVERSGYPEEELLGAHVTMGMDAETVERVEAHMAEFLADGGDGRTTIEYEVTRKGGERLPVENRISVRTDGEGRFSGSAGMLWDVTERRERQRELERQRERLTALNDLNDVVRDITDAVIDQSTREEIERIVCERLAASDSYRFAWVGDVDRHSQEVTLRAEAGVEGYLDDLTISADPDDERSNGPTGRALIEREIQVSRDVANDPGHDPWRGEIEAYGFNASAAIPIVHEGTLFGVLNVYADRADAFDDDEQAVVGQLGEVVGHAIAAVERKQALMSDEVVEIEFQIRGVFDAVGVRSPADGTISFERAVPVGDGAFLVYGTATGDAADRLDPIVESGALPHWQSVSVLAAEGDDVRFELRMDEPPVISSVASHGGHVHESAIVDGDYRLRVHLAPGTDVREVVDTVQGAFPTTVLVTRQQVTRNPPAAADPPEDALADLTDRQRTAIETAFYAGYFAWPRDSTGGDLAASLGIDPSTYHYHLREAQRKVLGSVLGAGGAR